MPIYTWECTDCGNVVETIEKMADSNKDPGKSCKCGINSWKKQVDAGGPRWYFND